MRRRDFLAVAGMAAHGAPAIPHIGCQSRTYALPSRDRAALDAILDQIKAAGYDGFECNYICLEASFNDPSRTRDELARRGLRLAGLHMGVRFPQPETYEKSRADVARVAAAVRSFGGDHLMLSGAAAAKNATKEEHLRAFDRKAAEVERLGRICRDAGITLAVHNHTEEAEDDWAEYRHLLAHTTAERVRLLIDIGHSARIGLDAAPFLREHSSRIAALHIKDYSDRTGRERRKLGTGIVRLDTVAQALRDTQWSGWLIAELEGEAEPGVTADANARHARAYIRDTLRLGA